MASRLHPKSCLSAAMPWTSLVVAGVMLCALTACQLGLGFRTSPKSASEPALEEIAGEVYPFTFRVLNEVNDGSKLHVRGEVISKEKWDSTLLALRLLSFRDGELIDREEFPFSSVMTEKKSDTELEADKPYGFLISAPTGGLSDYQIDLVWGDDARAMLKNSLPPSTTDNTIAPVEDQGVQLVVKDLQVMNEHRNCLELPCVVKYDLQVTLQNEGMLPIEGALFEIGLLSSGSALDESSPFLASQELEVTGLGLAPSASRVISVNYEETLVDSSIGDLKPQLRIISAQ